MISKSALLVPLFFECCSNVFCSPRSYPSGINGLWSYRIRLIRFWQKFWFWILFFFSLFMSFSTWLFQNFVSLNLLDSRIYNFERILLRFEIILIHSFDSLFLGKYPAIKLCCSPREMSPVSLISKFPMDSFCWKLLTAFSPGKKSISS